jgi:hypothetical protein
MSTDPTNAVDSNTDKKVEANEDEDGLVEVGQVSKATKGGLFGGSIDTGGNSWKVG